MAHTLRFLYGNDKRNPIFYVDIATTSGNIHLRQGGFTPRAGQVEVTWSGRSSRFDGQRPVNVSRDNAALSITYDLSGGTVAELAGAQKQVNEFFLRIKEYEFRWKGQKTWLEYGWQTYGLPAPALGQLNQYYRVLHADVAEWPGDLHTGALVAGNIEGVVCSLTCDPYPEGLKELAFTAGGAIRDDCSVPGADCQGLLIPPATTNLITNPSFGHGTYSNDWTASDADLEVLNETRDGYYRSLNSSVYLRNTDASSQTYTQTLTLTEVTCTISCYARRPDGAAVTSADMVLWGQGAALTTTFTQVGTSVWYRATATFTGAASSSTHGIQVKTGKEVFIDDVQLELGQLTPFCSGYLLGCAWAGTAHDSSGTRSAATFTRTLGNELAGSFTIEGWAKNHISTNGTVTLKKDLSNENPAQTFVEAIAYGNGVWLAGTYPDGQIWKSTDAGGTWALKKDLGNEAPAQESIPSLAYGNGVWLAGTGISGQIWKSTDDGETWALAEDIAQTYIKTIAYNSGVWLAGCWGNGHIYKSTDDGDNWVLKKNLGAEVPAQSAVLTIAYGNGVWLAGTYSSSSQIWKSTDDGETWALAETFTGIEDVYSIAYNSGVWLAGLSNGYVYKSTDDGDNWTLKQDIGGNVYTIAYGNGVWLAGTYGGQILESTNDGDIWTLVKDLSAESPSQTYIYTIAYNNGTWLAGTRANAQIWKLLLVNGNFISYSGTSSRIKFGYGLHYYLTALFTNSNAASSWELADITTGDNHFAIVFNTTSLILYLNGVVAYTGTVTGVLDSGGTLAIGPLSGGIDGLRIFRTPLTATQIAALYANEYDLRANGRAVGLPPYAWTKDGDAKFDTVDGVISSAAKDNWFLMGGIGGDVEALTEIRFAPPTSGTSECYYLGRSALYDFYTPYGDLFLDFSGTADVGASSGDAYETDTTDGSGTDTHDFDATITAPKHAERGRFQFLGRFKCTTTAIDVKPYFKIGSSAAIYGDTLRVATNASFLFRDFGDMLLWWPQETTPSIITGLLCTETAAAASTVQLDFLQLLPYPFCKVESAAALSLGAGDLLVIDNDEAYILDASSSYYQLNFMEWSGQPITLLPGRYNIICVLAGQVGVAYTVTDENTLLAVYVTPRYLLPGGPTA